MPNERGCNLAENRLYDVDNHIWLQDLGDGRVKIGMTSVATAMAGQLVAFTPKKVGRSVKPGKSCATVESGKWVGPAKSAVGGEVLEVNSALVDNPSLANDDPYEAGWMVIIQAEDWDNVKPSLVDAADVVAPYEAKMAADGFEGCE